MPRCPHDSDTAGQVIPPMFVNHPDHTVGMQVTLASSSGVGPFARLRAGAAIDSGAYIGNFVELKGAHVGQGGNVCHLSYLGDADVGDRANIGAGTITCNYSEHYFLLHDLPWIVFRLLCVQQCSLWHVFLPTLRDSFLLSFMSSLKHLRQTGAMMLTYWPGHATAMGPSPSILHCRIGRSTNQEKEKTKGDRLESYADMPSSSQPSLCLQTGLPRTGRP